MPGRMRRRLRCLLRHGEHPLPLLYTPRMSDYEPCAQLSCKGPAVLRNHSILIALDDHLRSKDNTHGLQPCC